MRIAAFVVLALAVCGGQQQSSNQQSINSIRQKSGDCSVNVAGIQGAVTVQLQCPGVPREALKPLEAHLRELVRNGQVEESRLRKESDGWKNLYLDALESLANAEIGTGLSLKAKDLLEKGEFDRAREVLEKAAGSDEKNVDRAAEDHSRLAQLYWLQFQPLKAIEELGLAYEYRPRVPAYGVDYQMMLLSERRNSESEKVGLQVLEVCRSLDKADPDRIKGLPIVLNNLGLLYKQTSRLKEAETFFNEAIETGRGVPRDNVRNQEVLAASLVNLADLYRLTKRFGDATDKVSEAISVLESLNQANGGVYELELADALNNSALIRMDLRDYIAASGLLQRVLEIQRSHGIDGGRGSPKILANLAIVYREMCDLERAEGLLTDVVKAFRGWAAFNPSAEEPDLAIALKDLGLLYLDAGKPEPAEAAFKEHLSIYERLADKDKVLYSFRRTTAVALLAKARLSEGKKADAMSLFQRALGELEQGPRGPERPDDDQEYLVAEVKSSLGGLHAGTNHFSDAEQAYKESISIYEHHWVPSELSAADLAEACSGLAGVYKSLNRPNEAEPYYTRASFAYRGLAQTSCSATYRRRLAESLAGIAWAKLELKLPVEAKTAALDSALAYKELRSVDPTFGPDLYARELLGLASVLKESGKSTDEICVIATEARNNATDAANMETARSFLAACH